MFKCKDCGAAVDDPEEHTCYNDKTLAPPRPSRRETFPPRPSRRETYCGPISDILVCKDKRQECSECREPIEYGSEVVRIGEDILHLYCCECKCGQTVEKDPYGSDGWVMDTQIICGDCIQNEKTVEKVEEKVDKTEKRTCAGCLNPLKTKTKVCSALGKRYHLECFVCFECRAKFEDKNFYVLDQNPCCKQCYHGLKGTICGLCNLGIEGPCVVVESQRFHPHCFVCDECGRELSHSYFEHNNMFLCDRDIKAYGSHKKRQTKYE